MLNFEIPALSCAHCVRAVTEALHEADAQARVEVDLGTKQVRVESSAPREVLVTQLTAAGYPPA